MLGELMFHYRQTHGVPQEAFMQMLKEVHGIS